MHLRCAIAVLILGAAMFAQSTPCPADRPVDDIIAEIAKQQSKKNSRNKNPLPENICIFGLCREIRKAPRPAPPPAPREEAPAGTNTSSSRTAADKCNDATDRAIEAAHNVEVGDFNFDRKNYRGALFRYQDALEQKPGDAAIHVRLGRAFEKLSDVPQALDHYKTAVRLGTPEPWSEEARQAIARLQPPP